jgi:hypothetical protein
MSTLLTDLQFEQLENHELKRRLSTIKHDAKIAKLEIAILFTDLSLLQSTTNLKGFMDDEIILSKEDRNKILAIICNIIKND